MHVTYRPGTAEDVEGCFRLLPPGFACEAGLRARLPEMWHEWLRGGRLQMTALEDNERLPGQRLVAFGSSVFITDDFAEELRAGRLPPSPAAHVARREIEGRSPILDTGTVRRANSGVGLNVLVMHIGWDEKALTPDEIRWVKSKLIEAFFFTHGGYQIKELLQEVYSEEEMRRGLAAGTLLRTDYARFFDNGRLPPPLRPYLIGTTRAEAQDGSTIAPAFFYTPPRFFFKPWEQDLLCHVLLGRSDAEVAARLHISPSTVQKRWYAIHERAAAAAPELFHRDAPTGQTPQTRGAEKRRHLLGYLRHHPEDLRPILTPEARKRSDRRPCGSSGTASASDSRGERTHTG